MRYGAYLGAVTTRIPYFVDVETGGPAALSVGDQRKFARQLDLYLDLAKR